MFATRAEWLAHEQQAHLLVWRCRDHPTITYKSQVEFKTHMRSQHISLTTLEVEASIEYSKTVVEDTRDHCRMCLVNILRLLPGQTLANHLAHHFETFARPSFPDHGGEEDDVDSDDDQESSADGEISILPRDTDLDDMSEVEPDDFEDAPTPVELPTIHALAMSGNKYGMRTLLDDLPDLNLKDGEGWTALQRAAYAGQSTTLQMLLSAGAEINHSSGYYGNALQSAASQGHDEVLRSLIDSGANVNQQGGYYGNALTAAVRQQHTSTVELLVDAGADSNVSNVTPVASALTGVSIASSSGRSFWDSQTGRYFTYDQQTNELVYSDGTRVRYTSPPPTGAGQGIQNVSRQFQNLSVATPSASTAPTSVLAAGRAIDGAEVVRNPQVRGVPPRRVPFSPAIQRGLLDPGNLLSVAAVKFLADNSRIQGARPTGEVFRSRQGRISHTASLLSA